MKKYLPILARTGLFAGVGEEDVASLLTCLDAEIRTFPKGAYVCRRGEHLRQVMVLAEGALHIRRDDYWGNCSILGRISPGEMFGEAYVAPGSGALPNDVLAIADSTVVYFDVGKLMTTCSYACRFHTAVVQNLFYAISEKNRYLVQKLGHMSKRSTREKLLSYLSEEADRQNSGSFSIPFNRQQLADFLSVDRSAMSNELCKLRDEGLLCFEKNHFELKERGI